MSMNTVIIILIEAHLSKLLFYSWLYLIADRRITKYSHQFLQDGYGAERSFKVKVTRVYWVLLLYRLMFYGFTVPLDHMEKNVYKHGLD